MLPLGAAPKVGDPFEIDYDVEPGSRLVPAPGASGDWEVITQNGGHLTLRAFRAGDLDLAFQIVDPEGAMHEATISQTIESVLGEGDTEPAPLMDPVKPRTSPVGWILPGVVALAAMLLWLPLLRSPAAVQGEGKPEVPMTFVEELARIRRMSVESERYAALADAVRRLLGRIDPNLREELTSRELIDLTRARLSRNYGDALEYVLAIGDQEKFSGRRADPRRFDDVFSIAARFATLEDRSEAA